MVNTFPISIDFTPPNRHGYAKGGLAQKAEEVRQAVDNRDTVLIHVNPEEYEQIKKIFGPARINPHTGIPQFGFFSDVWDTVKDFVAPAAVVAANIFAPGIGTAIGSGLSSALGLGLGETAASALGSGLIGGGLGALTGGTKGALLGGALGAVSPYALGALGVGPNASEDGLLSGLGLGSNVSKAATDAATSASYPSGEMASLAELSAKHGASEAGGLSSVLGGGTSLMKYAPLLLVGAALGGGGGQKQASGPTQPAAADKNQTTRLSNVEFNRKQTNPNVTTSYGYGPAAQFFENNRLPSSGVVTAAEGRYVRGGGTGTSDSIPAKLSDGEYVIDSGTVSMLGDGSSDAGAAKLDKMREEIRKHKGGALAKGKFPPDAKSPLSYMKGA